MRWSTVATVAGVGIVIVALLSMLTVSVLADRANDRIRRDLNETVEPFGASLERLQLVVHRTSAEARAYALTTDTAARARYEAARAELAAVEEELLLDAAGGPFEEHAANVTAVAAAHTAVAEEVVELVDEGDLLGAMRLVIDDEPPRLQDFDVVATGLRNDVRAEAERLQDDAGAANREQRALLIAAAAAGAVAAATLVLLTVVNARLYDRAAAARARLESMIGSLGEGIYEVDARGRITYVNAAGAEMLGYAADELVGRDAHPLIHTTRLDGSPLPAQDCRIFDAVRAGGRYSGLEAFTRKDDSTVPVEVSTSPVVLGGRTAGAVVVFSDVRERLRQERTKDDFLAFASHELRSPLTTVHGFARFLRNRLHEDPAAFTAEAREAIEALDAEATRMADIIETFLDLTRIESGRLRMLPSDVDLRQLMSEEVERLLVRHPSAVVRLDAPARSVRAHTDANRVRQMLTNLLDNAAKYGGEPPHIDIGLAVEGEAAKIVVRDHGPGIPARAQPYIFERFYQADGILPRRSAGLGVGLFITKQIADSLGGRIEFTSTPSGTEFALTLPLGTAVADASSSA